MNKKNDALGKRILDVLRKHGEQGLRGPDLRRRLNLRSPTEARLLRAELRRLEGLGQIERRKRGRYTAVAAPKLIPGTFSYHRNGYGFVTPDAAGHEDIFIPPNATGDALPGDKVLVAITDRPAERGPVGIIRRILQRGREETTGELIAMRRGLFVRPLRRDYPPLVPVRNEREVEENIGVAPGDWVRAVIERADDRRRSFFAIVKDRLGSARTVDGDLDAIIAEFELPPPYTPEEVEAAAHLTPSELPRHPIEHEAVVTIDPEDAKDFDDALSIGPGPRPGTVEVGVHIADVAAYVPAGSDFDAKARLRGFTAYLPGRTLPMLPFSLVTDKCSLREGEARPAHSVYLIVDTASGRVLRARRTRSTVVVTRRLSFREVESFLKSAFEPDWPAAVRRTVKHLHRTAEVMRRFRAETEHFLEIRETEVRVQCTERPARILGLVRVEQGPAHEMVEEFMLAANVAVAEELVRPRIPGIFRVHPPPKPADLEAFRQWARKTFGLRARHLHSRDAINELLRQVKRPAARQLLEQTFLRALPRAVYSGVCRPHYGLGKDRYCHFTSPIRRYPDLVVHQQLWSIDSGCPPVWAPQQCAEFAEQATEQEARVDEAGYAALDRLKLRYVRDLVERGETPVYEATVVKIGRAELTLFLPELGMFGVLSRRSLPRDRYVAAHDGLLLRGLRTGFRAHVGASLFVEPQRVDLARGIFELRPVTPRL